MKSSNYQLVLQFSCESATQFDAIVELEEKLLAEFADSSADVDGHDAGSGEANIFIITPKPVESFARAHVVVQEAPSLASVLRAGYRHVDSNEYSVLWPKGATRFLIA